MNPNKIFTCDFETGILYWKYRPKSMFNSLRAYCSWNANWANKETGHFVRSKTGAKSHVGINCKSFPMTRCAHRIIWEMRNGPIPEGMVIDHINGDPWDNRIENLRVCSQSQNMRNSARHFINGHGVKGVSWDKVNKKWQTEIRTDKGRVFLGRHITKGLAALAYAKAAMMYHGEYSPVMRP